jgi:hypothetical protein
MDNRTKQRHKLVYYFNRKRIVNNKKINMKQLLFLILFPCLAMAQYPGNGNQKITLGEQTTADGLVYRGLAADTTRKPSVDTMAFILLDTNTNIIWQYKKATNNAWTRVGGSISSGLTGELPVANGGTGENMSGLPNNYLIRKNSSGVFDTSIVYEANGRVGIGTNNPTSILDLASSGSSLNFSARLFTNGATGPSFTFIKKRGTLENPLDVQNGDNMGELNFSGAVLMRGYNSLAPGPNFLNGGFKILISSELAGGSAERFTMISSGFTGIGVTVPTERLHVANNVRIAGNIAAGVTSATARLHLTQGTATASTAPLKFTSQGASLLNPVEAGAVEFNGTNLLFTPSTTRHTVNHGLTGSATLDFVSTNAQNSRDMTISVTGAADGDVVSLGVPNAAVNANTSYSAWVSAANTVTVRFNNYSSGTVDPASGLFKVFVTK